MANELKPCPCCGGEATIDSFVWGGLNYRIVCSCGIITKYFVLLEEATTAWNRRDGEGTILCEHEYQPGFFIILSTREEVPDGDEV